MAHIHAYVWDGSRFTSKVDEANCRAAVHERGQAIRIYQCGRKAKVTDAFGLGWCTQHSPEKVTAQRAKQKAKWDAESAQWDRKQLVLDVGRAFIKAMEENGGDAPSAGITAARVMEKARKKG